MTHSLLFGLALLLSVRALAAEPGEQAIEAVRLFHEAPATAVDALSVAIEREPFIASALRVLLAEALLAAGRRGAARTMAERAAEDARWASRARFAAARAAMPEDCAAALSFADLATPDPPAVTAPARLALIATAAHACADADRAAAATRELAIEHPETDEGREAAGRIALTDAERLRRAASFERARDYASAATELTALYGTPLAAEARFEWAKLQLERVREDFDAAEKAFAALAAEPGPFAEESMWLRARALGRKGDVVAALSAFAAYLKRHPKGRFAADARFFSAFLQYEVGRYADAARAFSRLDDPAWRTSARWYHAWCLYLAGDRKAAVPALDAIAAADPRGNEGRKAAYWAARALEKKSPSEAAARMQRLVTARPHDWYGLMARRRAPKRFANIAALPGAPSPPDPPVPIVFAGPVAEIRGLATAGLPDLARRALATLSPLLRSTDGWALEATLAAQIGDAERQMRGTLTRHHALFVDPPRAEDAPIWRAAWPRGHADAVNTAAGRFGVAPSLVFAFIRKESAFAPEAISPAHAVGLMQLLPRTARAIQEARGLGDQPAPDLFEPARNIELGTWYVAALQHRFGGALPLVAAAYNAGPSAVRQWAAGRARVATDLFVDTIPFRETRQYVKRMVETQVLYEMVHGGRDLNTAAEVLPVELDLTIAPGVDF